MDLLKQLKQYVDVDKLVEFLTTTGASFLLNLLTAVLVYVIGRIVAGLIRRALVKILERAKVDPTLVGFISNLTYALMIVFVIISALERLGVDTTSFAAIVAAAGLAIGLALQGSLGNFASGVLLILFKPFKVGEYVEVAGSAGTVKEIQIFTTVLKTGDNVIVTIPNGAITGGTITNYSSQDTRRIDLVFGCGYGDDLLAVKAYLGQVVSEHPLILQDPAPSVAVSELGDSSVNFAVRSWVKASDYWTVRPELLETVKLGFDERGFNIPYPTQDVNVHTAANAAA